MATTERPDIVAREWEYFPVPDGESFVDKDGDEVVGWHPRHEGQDELALLAEFEAFYEDGPLELRPILVRDATEVECRINGWDEGAFVRCTTRAKAPRPMWQVVVGRAAAGVEGDDGT
jgi:hypothetical protein